MKKAILIVVVCTLLLSALSLGCLEKEIEVELGETVTLGDIELTIHDCIECEGHIFNAPKGAKVILVWITVKNVGEKVRRTPGRYDVELEYDGERVNPQRSEQELIYEVLYPSVKEVGKLFFVVPKGSDTSKMKIHFQSATWIISDCQTI